jgi:hypothetical protein
MSFLGKKIRPQFEGEIVSDVVDLGFKRIAGSRIKHRVKQNWLKMYDKAGSLLRLEMVIHEVKEFCVRKEVMRKGKRVMKWVPMLKGVAICFVIAAFLWRPPTAATSMLWPRSTTPQMLSALWTASPHPPTGGAQTHGESVHSCRTGRSPDLPAPCSAAITPFAGSPIRISALGSRTRLISKTSPIQNVRVVKSPASSGAVTLTDSLPRFPTRAAGA